MIMEATEKSDSNYGVSKNNSSAFRVMLPLRNIEEARMLLPFAEIITNARRGQLIILDVTAIHRDETLSEGTKYSILLREELSASINDLITIVPQSRTMVCQADEIWEGIWAAVADENINLLIFGWSIPSGYKNNHLQMVPVLEFDDNRLDSPPCEILIVRPAGVISKDGIWNKIRSILIPSRGGENASLVLRIADSISTITKAPITLLHVSRISSRDQEDEFYKSYRTAMYGMENIKRTISVKGEIIESIIKEARKHDIVIMGAPSHNLLSDNWRGSLIEEVGEKSNATIVVVKNPAQKGVSDLVESIPIKKQMDKPFTVVVDKWFAENTYHSREFADLQQLVAMKKSQDLTISLGLPALNEADTVGNVITTLKNALMDDAPLLDEIVLIDSGSIDYTREIAMDHGIPVHIHQDLLRKYGSYHGKGEALWKSLYILEGDIIIWVDTDIRNIHPRFVFGILGPLLKNPNIQYVKGFYRRPLRQGEKLVAGGGGRVTELTVRPLINLFYPELSGLVQPLSGEYAGRRSALETLPFFTGYGVETGLLIDILAKFGVSSIAQTDLLQRIHHNQPLPSLSKMSFAIMQVVFSRLESKVGVNLLQDSTLSMNLVQYERTNYYLGSEEIIEHERPPIVTLPEYLEKRNLKG